jgi:broad specificity phosphatase PhoE
MTRVHLVRHGRTASNRERRTMGWLDEGIEPGWVRAAAAVADVLAQEPVDWLVSSPLARAVQTAAPLATLLSRSVRKPIESATVPSKSRATARTPAYWEPGPAAHHDRWSRTVHPT